jgi:hypothetical protein
MVNSLCNTDSSDKQKIIATILCGNYIIDEITDILGIRVFRVKPKGKPVGTSPASVPLLQQASEAIPK